MVVVAGALAFFYLVWPTRYRYDHVRFGSASTVARTDRLTGNSEILDGRKWMKVRAAEGPVEDMTSAQIGKLKGQASINAQGQLNIRLYNGTEFELKEITVEVTIRQGEDGKVMLDRLYRMTPDMGGGPFEMASFEADLGYQPDYHSGIVLGVGPDRWKIKSAKGVKAH